MPVPSAGQMLVLFLLSFEFSSPRDVVLWGFPGLTSSLEIGCRGSS